MRTIFRMVLTTLVLLAVPMVSAEYNIFYLAPDGDINCDNPGADVTAWAMVNTSNDVNAFQASIIFDPNIVNITAEEGDVDWYIWEYLIGDFGDKKYISLRGSDLLNTYGPGELQLGKITLHGEANGVCPLHFGNTSELGCDRTELSNQSGMICTDECTMLDGTFTCGTPCLGNCSDDSGALVASDVPCYVCLGNEAGYTPIGASWKPTTRCPGRELYCPDIYFNSTTQCPACCDGIDNDGDGKVDCPADPGCACCCDETEGDDSGHVPCVPELPTLALAGIGILGIALLARKRN